MNSLSTLDLAGNALTGTIPLQLGLLTLVKQVDLSYNRLWGTLPHRVDRGRKGVAQQIGNLANSLTILNLEGNPSLGGAVPPGLWATSNPIKILRLANCSFTGQLPGQLPNSLTSWIYTQTNSVVPYPLALPS